MKRFERWKTVKELKDILDQYDEDDLVFIEPHKYIIDYPFYVYQSGNRVLFRFYNDSLLPLTFQAKIEALVEKWRHRLCNLVHYKREQ